MTDFGHCRRSLIGDDEIGLDRLCSLDEQSDSFILGQSCQVAQLLPPGSARAAPEFFAVDAERLTAGGCAFSPVQP
jgi:hypothetical protein